MAGTGILSKGIELKYQKGSEWIVIPDLQEIPELGGTPEQVEVTTLADGAKRYIAGIKDFGELQFKFLYDNAGVDSSYRICRELEDSKAIGAFKVVLPDQTEFAFSASVSTKLDSAGINAPLTFTAALSLNSDMEVKHPTATQSAMSYKRGY